MSRYHHTIASPSSTQKHCGKYTSWFFSSFPSFWYPNVYNIPISWSWFFSTSHSVFYDSMLFHREAVTLSNPGQQEQSQILKIASTLTTVLSPLGSTTFLIFLILILIFKIIVYTQYLTFSSIQNDIFCCQFHSLAANVSEALRMPHL